jgi:beta-1,2-mannosidase
MRVRPTPQRSPAASPTTAAPQTARPDVALPENQPVNRWGGQGDIPLPPAEKLPGWLGAPFSKRGIILSPDPNVSWKSKDVFNPAAIVHDGVVHLFPRCEDVPPDGAHWVSRVGHYVSDDGVSFRPASQPDVPVLQPTEPYERAGCEDPRVVQLEDGLFVMTYTAYDGATARLALATSTDLTTWTKHGLVFDDAALTANAAFRACHDGRPWTKSGGIVPQKIGGEYVMYFGENDLFVATSKDGVNWAFDAGEAPVLSKRAGFFDQGLVEPGPPPFVDDEGIHLLYHGDGPPLGYQLGEAVFSKDDPRKVLRRSASTLLKPDQPYEQKGQVGAVIFAEGLVQHRGQWMLYYGAADGHVALATAPAGGMKAHDLRATK